MKKYRIILRTFSKQIPELEKCNNLKQETNFYQKIWVKNSQKCKNKWELQND